MFIGSDRRHVLWATKRLLHKNCEDEPWKAIVIDVDECRVVFESGEHREMGVLDAEIQSTLSHTVGTRLWKRAKVWSTKACDLPGFWEENIRGWQIVRGGGVRVKCGSHSTGGNICDQTSIDFDSSILSVAAQWLPLPGADGHRRAFVACALVGRSAPAVLHFIHPQVSGPLSTSSRVSSSQSFLSSSNS